MAPPTITPNRFQLKKSVALSFLVHLSLLALFLFIFRSDQAIQKAAGVGDSGFVINVELVGSTATTKSDPVEKGVKAIVEKSISNPANSLSGDNSLDGGEGGTSQTLQQIRNKIERNKYYPLLAKRSQIEGSPLVEFKIKQDGSLEYVNLKQSSGSKILDDAALSTVKEAAPYPFHSEPIVLNIHYGLNH